MTEFRPRFSSRRTRDRRRARLNDRGRLRPVTGTSSLRGRLPVAGDRQLSFVYLKTKQNVRMWSKLWYVALLWAIPSAHGILAHGMDTELSYSSVTNCI